MNPAAHLVLRVIVYTDFFGHWIEKEKQYSQKCFIKLNNYIVINLAAFLVVDYTKST